jgi:hypothetical protein
MTSLRPLRDRFLDAEVSLGLWERTFDGSRYWHTMRHAWWGHVARQVGGLSSAQGSWRDRSWWNLVRNRTAAPQADHARARLRNAGRADVLVSPHHRHEHFSEGWACPHTWPLLRDAGFSTWIVEQADRGLRYRPPAQTNVTTIERSKFLAYARYHATHRAWGAGGTPQRATAEAEAWLPAMSAALGVSGLAMLTARLIRRAGRDIAAYESVYEELIDRVRPKVVLNTVHYADRNLPLTRVARRHGIPVVEVQHGVMSATHLAYNLPPLPPPEAFPDYLLTFGRWWRDQAPGLPLSAERCIPIGSAWLESARARLTGVSRSAEPTLVVISQPSVGEPLTRFAVEAATQLAGSPWHIVVKLHPGERDGWRGRYPWLAASSVPVITDGSVHEALASAHAQLGVYSTALFEGLAFDLPTFVVPWPGSEVFDDLVRDGMAAHVATPAELAGRLRAGVASPGAAADNIWQTDATTHFRDFMWETFRL